jgi:hypothetical protein
MRFLPVLPLVLALPTHVAIPDSGDLNLTHSPTTRLPRNNVNCDNYNTAPHIHCASLIKSLRRDKSQVQKEPRHIQHEACFVSWHTEWSGTKATLSSYAQEVLDTCSDGVALSGARDKNGLRVCVSNRGKYC